MKVIEKGDEIILRDYPLTNWGYGIMSLMLFALFSVPIFNSASLFSSQTSKISLIFCFVIAGFALYFAWEKFSSPVMIVRFKLSEQIVEIKNIYLLSKTRTEIYKFARISRFETVQRKFDRTYLYYNVMILKDGSCVDLESSGMISQTNRIPAKLNEIIKQNRREKRR